MKVTVAKRQPRGTAMHASSCDECVGDLIEAGIPDEAVAVACRNVMRYGQDEDQVTLVNVLIPGHGTVQFTLCNDVHLRGHGLAWSLSSDTLDIVDQ